MKPIRVLFASAEMTPIAKAGGLGDVIGALPQILGHQVERLTIALPFHEEIPRQNLQGLERLTTVTIKVAEQPYTVAIWKARYKKMNLLLFEQADFLSRGEIYEGVTVLDPLTLTRAKKDNIGTCIKYLFFCYALQAFLQQRPNAYNLVHAHDFHLAPLLALVRHDDRLAHLKTVLTIHNLIFDGPLLAAYWQAFSPSLYSLFNTAELLRPKGPRMLRLGIQWADLITTVSPQYAHEILTPEYGNNLELLLQDRQTHLKAVLNGIDTSLFNPLTDPIIHRKFSLTTLKRRTDNKQFLQRRCHLPVDPRIPVIGIVTRLHVQKGIELILNSLPQLSALPVQFVVCGTGPLHYARAFQAAQQLHPEQWHFHNSFDTVFSQHVYAGSDIFLMPSRHEPCGLAQLIAMRYGAVPVVRATGGLKDTITDGYNGFLFKTYSSAAMLTTIKRTIKTYQTNPLQWERLTKHGMSGDYSWKKSATAYLKLYQTLLS